MKPFTVAQRKADAKTMFDRMATKDLMTFVNARIKHGDSPMSLKDAQAALAKRHTTQKESK